ncbi:MAG: hypothetical protein MPN21_14295 [Thermoanaerobaculia bacterium]|nr:hypothetical protein [Thermoanaerobaculia bacterium]
MEGRYLKVAADSRWRLRDGTRLDRVADLPEETRTRLGVDGEDPAPSAAVLSRPGARTSLVLVDPDAADLLERFDSGKSVAQAVLDLSRSRDLEPYGLLEAALPALERLVRKGYLIDADAPPTLVGFQPGDVISGVEADWRIVRVLARLEDSEVHLVRRGGQQDLWGVLKLSTPERTFGRPEQESEMLRYLEARATELDVSQRSVPRLLDEGSIEGAEAAPIAGWIVLEFLPGVASRLFARGLRRSHDRSTPGPRRELVRLCTAATRALADLHRLGVVHGDVHPDNLLVTGAAATPRVWLVDLGCARRLDDGRDLASRPGVDLYREPEVAAALLARRRSPAATPAGEQYALAVLLYELVSGHSYLDFAADRRELLRQIAEERPRSFDELPVDPWPEMESVLGRALSKDPKARFTSLDALAEKLEDVERQLVAEEKARPETDELAKAAGGAVRRARPGGAWWVAAADGKVPASLYYGSAGLSRALLHAALRRGDEDLLALADLWASRALRDATSPEPEPEQEQEQELEPQSSTPRGELPRLASAPLHGLSGIYETAACVAWARGDFRIFVRTAREFLKEAAQSDDSVPESERAERDLDVDPALGRPGLLISTAHLLDRARPPHADGSSDGEVEDRFHLEGLAADLTGFGNECLDELWQRLDQRPEVGSDDAYLGLAHGWAGVIYASLIWCHAADRQLPSGVARRLQELVDEAVPHGRGLRWTRARVGVRSAPTSGRDSMAGWCHGAAGHLLLFHTAARWPQLASFREPAESAALDIWDRFVSSRRQVSHLCCGLIGQAWSLLVHARETGEDVWRHRARLLAESAVRRPVFDTAESASQEDPEPYVFDGALFKGAGSLPALHADLEHPSEAAWPWLEDLEPPAPKPESDGSTT